MQQVPGNMDCENFVYSIGLGKIRIKISVNTRKLL